MKNALKHTIVALVGCAFALSATAQWQWVGKDGRKVFSDRPPPADVREKDIIKQPSVRGPLPVVTLPAESSENVSPAAGPAAALAKPKTDPNALKISGKDADLQAKKKKLEEEEAAKKKAEEEKIALNEATNCERAKKALATYQSGVRVASTNAKGEREIMDDSTKAAESKRMQTVIDRDCK